MNAHYFFFAKNIESGEVECFATKYLQVTNWNGSRFKFWRVNGGLEQIEKPKTVSWNHNYTTQEEQLQAALGEKWQVFSFWHVCNILSLSNQPTR